MNPPQVYMCFKKQIYYFANKGLYNQSYAFSSSHVWMWELDHKECWAPKNWCFCTVVLKKTLESPLDCKQIKSVDPKGNQCWIFIGRTDVEAETPVLWPSDVKSQFIGKDPDARKIESRRKRRRKSMRWLDDMTQWTWVWESFRRWWRTGKPGMCNPWGCKRSDRTEQLNNNSKVVYHSDWFVDLEPSFHP